MSITRVTSCQHLTVILQASWPLSIFYFRDGGPRGRRVGEREVSRHTRLWTELGYSTSVPLCHCLNIPCVQIFNPKPMRISLARGTVVDSL